MAQIVFLEVDTVTTGDLDVKQYDEFHQAILLNSTDTDKLFDQYSNVEVLLINKTEINSSVLEDLPNLKLIQILATGYDNVDLEACRERGIEVCNIEGYSTYSVAQHVFSLILTLTNKVNYHWQMARDGIWSNEPKFTFYTPGIPELHHKTLGIVGMGSIGSAVARIGKAFGMRIITHTRSPEKISDGDIRFVELDELARTADFVSLHLPLTQDTAQLVNAEFLSKMKEEAILINTARGGLIDEQALHDVLIVKGIRGAGLDVLTEEPPPVDHPLLSLPNCITTSHMAWATLDARQRLMKKAAENVSIFQREGTVPHSLA
ncbi:D-2-hydroxyacid dehydrogenase [Membranicola marinus]|uniref:D-2-hydroxyacid dehydrogenase n=1 Tax=Membranihabitans marinus TaxID=1227546 RepID=A0A953HK03_9BACT|nr:D-2-hydroxyacid dehydrogenase [Membranihabitans marinus]MBY5957112.1 D-2-hydroxyacid dehydrogenase [Membranihabitans marinus]